MDNDYEVIILAAGRGTRLGVLGEQVPKALISTGVPEETMVSRLIDQFKLSASRIHVVVGHKSNLIKPYLRENYPWLSVVENNRYHDLSNIVSLKKGLLRLSHSCNKVVIVDVDTYLSKESLLKIVELTKQHNEGIIFTTNSKRPEGEWAVESNSDHYITKIITKPDSSEHITSGVTLFAGESLKFLRRVAFNGYKSFDLDYWDDIYLYHYKDMELKSFDIPGFIWEIDNLDDITTINERSICYEN